MKRRAPACVRAVMDQPKEMNMTKPTLCEIVVVMDRSGSMEQIKNDMMGGFDNFMREQKAVPGECRVSLYQFDDKYLTVDDEAI